MLPHPGYVYTARYHPKVQKIVATGGFDQILRVWSLQDAGKHAQVSNTLWAHLLPVAEVLGKIREGVTFVTFFLFFLLIRLFLAETCSGINRK